jgi:uncharacterized protein (DUF2236 family)
MAAAGYFTDDSMIRRIQGEWAVALSGPRVLLMQAAHPVAFEGFFASSTALDDPYPRLERTARVMGLVTFGTKEQADRATKRVRAVHRQFSGELPRDVGRFPAGTPWRADAPDQLLWIIATLVDSGRLVYQRYVRPLSRDEQEAYWQDFRRVGKLFGLAYKDSPPDIDAFDAYMAEQLASKDMFVSKQARELAIDIVMNPPLPAHMFWLKELVNQLTIGLLPPRFRRMYGFRWDPVRETVTRAQAEYLKRVVVPLLPDRYRLTPNARGALAA